jgi:hypothetical protein
MARQHWKKTVNVDTTVQEKHITYPTDAKLAIKIINRLNKLAKVHGIQQPRTYEREVKALRLNIRHFRHVKRLRICPCIATRITLYVTAIAVV